MDPYFGKALRMKRILEYTEENSINFIVMGTYSLAGVKNFLTDNVVKKVVRYSKVSVMVIRRMQALRPANFYSQCQEMFLEEIVLRLHFNPQRFLSL